MNRLKYRTVWIAANGCEYNLDKMTDSHVLNCILLSRRKVKALEAENEDNIFDKQVEEWKSYIIAFKVELRRRKALGIQIDEEDEQDDYFQDMHGDG